MVLKKLIPLSLLSAGLAILSWPPNSMFYFIFIFLAPLFYLEAKARKKEISSSFFLLMTYLCFFIFYIITSRWLVEFNKSIGISVQLLNALFPTCSFATFHFFRKKMPSRKLMPYLIFVLVWMTLEIFQFNREIGFPHLILGNVFAMAPSIIQWYEWTGAIGGSGWVLMVNIFFYQLIIERMEKRDFRKWQWSGIAILLFPILISFYLSATFQIQGERVDITAIHSNIKSSGEKTLSKEEILNTCILETKTALDAKIVDYILWPEGAFNGGWIDDLNVNVISQKFLDFPTLKFAVGSTLFKKGEGEKYEKYITAIAFDTENPKTQIRSKYNMVPFSERAPLGFNILTKGLRSFTGKYSNVVHFSELPNKKNVFTIDEKIKPLSLLCYETIFPLTATDGVKEGANVIFIHANEVWFQPEVSGAEQTFYYSALRAIENRRFVARSTNGGVSGFIDPTGQVLQSTQIDGMTHLIQSVQLNQRLTFFSKFGFYLYRCIPLCLVLVLGFVAFPIFTLRPYNPSPLSP